jgi:hypothetical protein
MRYLSFCLAAFVVSTSAVSARAQEPARSLAEVGGALAPGDKVEVLGTNGQTVRGRLIAVSNRSLQIDQRGGIRQWAETDIREIRKRRPDVWWNGALVGAAIGGAVGYIIPELDCPNDAECATIERLVFTPLGLGLGAVAGALVDVSIKKFDTVFRLPGRAGSLDLRIRPIVSPEKKGLQLSFSF